MSKRILEEIGIGMRGSDVRRKLEAAPYGWPRDAVDAAFVTLRGEGYLVADLNGRPVASGQLNQATIGKTIFRLEKVRLGTQDRIRLRQLFDQLHVRAQIGQESAHAQPFLDQLKSLAAAAGGLPPLPSNPDTTFVIEISRLSGNEQLAAILESREKIIASITKWKVLADRAKSRVSDWNLANSLLSHADGLKSAEVGGVDLSAISEQRALLADTDHLSPYIEELAQALRAELVGRRKSLCGAVRQEIERIASDATWRKLGAKVREEILTEIGLVSPQQLTIDTTKALNESLNERNLETWAAMIDAVPELSSRALKAAAARLPTGEPAATFVEVQRGTLSTPDEVQSWIKEHQHKLTAAIEDGPVIVK